MNQPHKVHANAAFLDQTLDRLRARTTVDDRLAILRTLVEYWHSPIRSEDALPAEELAFPPLPRPLRWWYGWAGRRREIMSAQNILFAPLDKVHPHWQLKIEEDYLLFYSENQGVYSWATLPEGDDPPVFGRYETRDPWEPEEITLSEHLILATVFEAVMCHSPYGASAACLRKWALSKIQQVLTPIAINPWRWGETRFYARNGAFMFSMSDGSDVQSVWIGAKTEEPLQFLKPYLDDAWEYKAV